MKLAARYRSSGLLFHFFDKHHHAATQSWFLRLPADWDGRRDARTPNFYVHKTPNRAIVVDRIIVCSKSEKIFIMIFACSLPSDLYIRSFLTASIFQEKVRHTKHLHWFDFTQIDFYSLLFLLLLLNNFTNWFRWWSVAQLFTCLFYDFFSCGTTLSTHST